MSATSLTCRSKVGYHGSGNKPARACRWGMNHESHNYRAVGCACVMVIMTLIVQDDACSRQGFLAAHKRVAFLVMHVVQQRYGSHLGRYEAHPFRQGMLVQHLLEVHGKSFVLWCCRCTWHPNAIWDHSTQSCTNQVPWLWRWVWRLGPR